MLRLEQQLNTPIFVCNTMVNLIKNRLKYRSSCVILELVNIACQIPSNIERDGFDIEVLKTRDNYLLSGFKDTLELSVVRE